MIAAGVFDGPAGSTPALGTIAFPRRPTVGLSALTRRIQEHNLSGDPMEGLPALVPGVGPENRWSRDPSVQFTYLPRKE